MQILKILLPHVGLNVLLLSYITMGAIVFIWLEADNELMNRLVLILFVLFSGWRISLFTPWREELFILTALLFSKIYWANNSNWARMSLSTISTSRAPPVDWFSLFPSLSLIVDWSLFQTGEIVSGLHCVSIHSERDTRNVQSHQLIRGSLMSYLLR